MLLIKDLPIVSNSEILLKFPRKMLLKSKVLHKKTRVLMSYLTADRINLFFYIQVSC